MQTLDCLKVYQHKTQRFGLNQDGGYVVGSLDGGYDCYLSAGITHDEQFLREFVDYNNINDCDTFFTKSDMITSSLKHYNNAFLKMDIESFEYSWLLTLEESTLQKIKQMVVIFHSMDYIYHIRNMKLQCFEKLAKTHYVIHLYHYSNNIHNDMYETYEITYVNKLYFQTPPILQQFTFNMPPFGAEMNAAADGRISASSMRKHGNSLQHGDISYDENATESILGLYHGSKFKEIHLYNENHLGDCIFSCVYFYHIREYIESNHIHIFYYIRKEHISQVREFICSNNIHLCDFDKRKGLHIWIGNSNINTNIIKVFEGYADHLKKNNKTIFNEFLVEFYNTISAHFEIPYKMVSYQYCDPLLLDTYYELPDKYKNVDIFIINSRPLSSQYQYNEKEWDIRILLLNEKYNIVTTKKVDDVKCTLDDRLSVFRIAALSTRAKVIIAINTGPIVGLFNIYTLNHVKKVYISANANLYTYPNFELRNSIIDIPFHELDKYINT